MQSIKEIELQYVTNQAGEKTAVLLPIGRFEQLLEDLDDLVLIAERHDEGTVPHSVLLEELRHDGLLQN